MNKSVKHLPGGELVQFKRQPDVLDHDQGLQLSGEVPNGELFRILGHPRLPRLIYQLREVGCLLLALFEDSGPFSDGLFSVKEVPCLGLSGLHLAGLGTKHKTDDLEELITQGVALSPDSGKVSTARC